MGTGKKRLADRIFLALASGAGVFVVIIVVLVGVFLVVQAVPSIRDDKANFLFSRQWNVNEGVLQFGVAGLLWTTVIISLLAMIVGCADRPSVSRCSSPTTRRSPLAKPVAYVIDLLAAIPSIIYGIWGLIVLSPKLEGVQRTLLPPRRLPDLQGPDASSPAGSSMAAWCSRS